MKRRVSYILPLFALLGICCSTTHYKESADKEVYKAIAEKTPAVPGMDEHFTIDQDTTVPLDGLATADKVEEFLGEAGQSEAGAQVLSLEKALAIAVQHSRAYQSQKEDLYLQALTLTLERHQYTPIFAARGSGDYNRSTTDVVKVSDAALLAREIPGWMREIGNTKSQYAAILQGLNANLGQLAGTEGELISQYADVVEAALDLTGATEGRPEIMDERSISGGTSAGVGLLLKGGGQIAIDLTSNFLRFLTGDPRVTTSSALTASISQPLLRGAGRDIAAEQLTQAERDLLYGLRAFTQYRKEFAVRVASAYYGVLRARDEARNNWLGYQGFVKSLERQKAWADEGRLTQADLGRSEQAKLDSESSWISSVRAYKQSLDEFKMLLGLSTDAQVILDDGELQRLMEKGIDHPTIQSADAERVALVARLDLYTVRDEVDDALRRVKVAANALKPGLDLVGAGRVKSKPGDDEFDTLDWQRGTWSLGFDLDPDLDKKSERNSYRSALIDYERSDRQLEESMDEIKLSVREAWRTLDQAKLTYEIRKIGVDLNERRVEEQDLRAELGRATVLDQIDAQKDLVSARNQLTMALIGHTTARLALWRDMGILLIKEDGKWEEVTDAEKGPWLNIPAATEEEKEKKEDKNVQQ